MRIIAFITHSFDIRQILDHIGVDLQPRHIVPARWPPLWDDGDAHSNDGAQTEPDWDQATQPAPDCEVNQRSIWRVGKTAVGIQSPAAAWCRARYMLGTANHPTEYNAGWQI